MIIEDSLPQYSHNYMPKHDAPKRSVNGANNTKGKLCETQLTRRAREVL